MATGTETTTRVMLWTCPRSLSTAFARSIAELGNVEVFNEEFTTAFYFGPNRIHPRRRVNMAPHHSYAWGKKRLEADYKGKVAVFGKDFAYPLTMGHYDMLPQGFYHTFLIRNPTKVLPSLKLRFESVCFTSGTDLNKCMPVDGYTYKDLRKLYDHIQGLGLPTLVIDADDLLDDPVGMMQKYCQTTGLPFKESMVRWQPATCSTVNWHCSKALRLMNWSMKWYEKSLKSSGFKKPAPRQIDVESLTPDVQLAIEVCQPYYDYMYEQRMTLNTSD